MPAKPEPSVRLKKSAIFGKHINRLIKIGAKVVTHGRYVAFQMAEVAVPRNLFGDILRLIAELRPLPDPAPA